MEVLTYQTELATTHIETITDIFSSCFNLDQVLWGRPYLEISQIPYINKVSSKHTIGILIEKIKCLASAWPGAYVSSIEILARRIMRLGV
jgi:hypothetical protein